MTDLVETQVESISESGQVPETESLFSEEMTDEEKVVAFKKWMTEDEIAAFRSVVGR